MVCLPRPPGDGEAAEVRPHVADVLRAGADDWLAIHRPTPEQARFLRNLRHCRTAALGGHVYVCPECDYQVPVYNSCRNRHCPTCQALAQARWIAAREEVLLPVGHHHVVFTLPSQLRPLAQCHPRVVLGLLFDTANETLQSLAADHLDATVGITAVVHTWTRELGYHPHMHCIVTAGGLTRDGTRWIERVAYLFPVRRMRARFRDRVVAALNQAVRSGKLPLSAEDWDALKRRLPRKKWVVYTEAPFGRSTHVLQYLGRYTHRVAVTDGRLISADGEHVRFFTRDDNMAELTYAEFTRRFLWHILPTGFRKVRHYGLYAPGPARRRRADARSLIGDGDRPVDLPPRPSPTSPWNVLLQNLTGEDPLRCPRCAATPMWRYGLKPRPPASALRPVPAVARPP